MDRASVVHHDLESVTDAREGPEEDVIDRASLRARLRTVDEQSARVAHFETTHPCGERRGASEGLGASGQIAIYRSEDGRIKLDVRLKDQTIWLSQKQLTELFGKAKGTISEHIKHIFEDGELTEEAVVRFFRTTAPDGKQYDVAHYNLDMVLALGFRVRSSVAVRFRQWAAEKLKEYLVKGFVLDDERLKNYLDAKEIDTLNRIVVMFLDQAEFRAQRRKDIKMADWEVALDKFLHDTELLVLASAGTVSHEQALDWVNAQYDAFAERRRLQAESEASARYIEDLEVAAKLLEGGAQQESKPQKRQSKGKKP